VLIGRLILALGLVTVSGGGAAAASKWDVLLQNCQYGAPDLAVTACTAMINNLLEPPEAKSVALNNRARAHMQKGENDLAMADLNKAIALNPNYPEAFYNRGVIFNDAKAMPDRAIQDFTQAIAVKALVAQQQAAKAPKNNKPAKGDKTAKASPPPTGADYPEALNYRGLAYEALGQYDRAVQDFSAALLADPSFGPARANRGAAHAKLGQYQAALADDDAALRLDGAVASRWSARCWVKIKLAVVSKPADPAALGEAQSSCARALALDPGNTDALNGRGLIKLINTDTAGALVDFQAVLVADQKNNTALFGRGLAKRATGDTAGADADMSAAQHAAPLVTADFWEARLVPNP
jgi:tetratricopeptide (TPR) repeat protein